MLTRTLFIIILLAHLWSCDIKDNDVLPETTFVKIYDDDRFEQEYYPVDLIQTEDKGFLILAELKFDQSLFTAVYILKTDAMGNVEATTQLAPELANAVGGWSKIGNTYYFICMDSGNLTARLVPVDATGTPGTPIPVNGLTYPLVTSQDGDNIVLLSFDNLNNETILSVLNANGQVTNQVGYTIGAGVDVEKPIIDHLTRNGDRLPFTVGRLANGDYYFNGFYNYTFSLVFTNFGASPTGVCQGQLSQGGISAVASLANNSFGIARFNYGANYINPQATIPTNSITSSTDLGGNTFPEIESGATVKLLLFDDTAKWLYGTNTQGRQLVLYGFDQSSGIISGTEYLGSGNPYKFASFVTTDDGGLAILAETAIEGRFPRIALFKRDASFVNNLLN